MPDEQISKAFVDIAIRCGEVFGKPLPMRLLELGNPDEGWSVRFNPTDKAIGTIEPFRVHLSFNGWPAGVIDPYGGCLIADGEEPMEGKLIAWLPTAEPLRVRELPA